MGHGGAIFYHCEIIGSNCNISYTCISSCWAINPCDCLFAYIKVNNNINSNILCDFLSINYLHKYYSLGINALGLHYGNQTIKSTNTSYNNIFSCPLPYIARPNSFNSLFCNYINNLVSSHRGFVLHSNSNNKIFKSNIINNSSPLLHGIVTIWDNGVYNFEDITFLKNLDYLIFINSGSIHLNNCFISHSINKLYNILISTVNNIITENEITNTNHIHHFYTIFCEKNIHNTFENKFFLKSFWIKFIFHLIF